MSRWSFASQWTQLTACCANQQAKNSSSNHQGSHFQIKQQSSQILVLSWLMCVVVDANFTTRAMVDREKLPILRRTDLSRLAQRNQKVTQSYTTPYPKIPPKWMKTDRKVTSTTGVNLSNFLASSALSQKKIIWGFTLLNSPKQYHKSTILQNYCTCVQFNIRCS